VPARVSELSRGAARIGDVVELINAIAGQTNLKLEVSRFLDTVRAA
jgi:methyl-accepting chemotaxis protein